MRWYKHLVMGEKAGRRGGVLLDKICSLKSLPDTYVITPAAGGNNILDIYPVMVFNTKYYQSQDLLVMGVAKGYWEALAVAGSIVGHMYQMTGAFDLEAYIDRMNQAEE